MLASEIFTCPGVLLHTCSIDHRPHWWAGCFRADTAALLISLQNDLLSTEPQTPLVSKKKEKSVLREIDCWCVHWDCVYTHHRVRIHKSYSWFIWIDWIWCICLVHGLFKATKEAALAKFHLFLISFAHQNSFSSFPLWECHTPQANWETPGEFPLFIF